MLKMHGGIDWDTYYDWPIAYKEWYLGRLKRELEKPGSEGTQHVGNETPMRKINFAQLQKAFGGQGDR
jgi:hypothetical protein